MGFLVEAAKRKMLNSFSTIAGTEICGLEPSDVCNAFVEYFDQLSMDNSTPHWFVYSFYKFTEESHIHEGKEGGKEGRREGGKVGRREGEKEGRREGRKEREKEGRRE